MVAMNNLDAYNYFMGESMDRRLAIKMMGGCAISGLSGGIFAQEGQSLEGSIPKGFKHVFLKEDSNTVFYFFDFTCPISAAYHIPMLTWAKTAPKDIKTVFMPIVNPYDSKDKIRRSAKAAAGYYAGAMTAKNPDQLERFVTQVYSLRQDRGMAIDSDRLWALATSDSKLNLKTFLENTKKVKPEAIRYALDRFLAYKISESPAVAVAGQYSFTPSNTNGDPEVFFSILSGLSTQLILS